MRPIDADRLKEVFHRNVVSAEAFNVLIDNAPTVDVVERKHGEWVKNDNGTYSCSVCQSWIPNEQHYYANYCLHCGARMVSEE